MPTTNRLGVATVVLLVATLAAAACSRSPKPAADSPTATPPPTPRQFGVHGEVALDSVSITIERTPCFGFCPVYVLTLSGNGQVVYQGRNYVGTTGERRDTMSVNAFVELVDEFVRLRFEETPDEYTTRRAVERRGDRLVLTEFMATDLPMTILTLQLGSRIKTTRFYVDYPVEFRALADSIDSKSGALRWIAGGRRGTKGESNETR